MAKKLDHIKLYENFDEEPSKILGELPDSINTLEDIRDFLLTLAKHGKIYHFDDDATNIESFTTEEGKAFNKLMDQAFDLADRKAGGFWEGIIKSVVAGGYVVFSINDGKVYIINNEGGPGRVKVTTEEDWKNAPDKEEGVSKKFEDWFNKLPNA